MSRPIHFEIHVDDIARARTFYETALGWTFEDWSEYAGMPYLGATTGTDDGPGINGALMQRQGGGVTPGAPIQGAVLTIGSMTMTRSSRRSSPPVARWRCRSRHCREWRGRATTSTQRAMCSAFTSPTRTPNRPRLSHR